MSIICAICQQPPEEPVVSLVSGHVFEKRLIVKYITEHGKDPISQEPLEEAQLVDIKPFAKIIKPKLPALTSIPSILTQLRDEWDASVLDSFELKQNLMTTRQELSHALYQLDAAYRVIARLKMELDQRRLEPSPEGAGHHNATADDRPGGAEN